MLDNICKRRVPKILDGLSRPRTVRLFKLVNHRQPNQKSGIFTLTRMSNDDCMYLDRKSRLCTIYDKRPDTCRNHPKIGPRPGYCAYKPKAPGR